MRHRVVAFVGKQDPHRHDGQEGPLMSAAGRLPLPVTSALLLFAEGASDRADGRDDNRSDGTQELRSLELEKELKRYWPDLQAQSVSLTVDPTDARAVLRALRDHPAVQAARADSQDVETHLLVAGGTPAMREVLSALQVTEFFGQTRGWYRPDRGEVLREEVPVLVEASLLSSLRTAVSVGEFRAAKLLLKDLKHDESARAAELLDILDLEQQGDISAARDQLRSWSAPDVLKLWKQEATRALTLHGQRGGLLMHRWNATQVRVARTALLAYATMLEDALRELCAVRSVRIDRDAGAKSMADALQLAKQRLPVALDAARGIPYDLYRLRSDAIHRGVPVRHQELVRIQNAATDLVRTFPAPQEEIVEFLRKPHHNPFAPQRHGELAQALFNWLNG